MDNKQSFNPGQTIYVVNPEYEFPMEEEIVSIENWKYGSVIHTNKSVINTGNAGRVFFTDKQQAEAELVRKREDFIL